MRGEKMPQRLAVDGAELHYKSVGSGPAVLAIGGAGAGVLEFRRTARRLAKEFQFISYDRRGTLESTGRVYRDLDFAQESHDIVTLLDTLGVSQTVLFATCGGASVGFDLVTRYPEYVRAYIIHEPINIRMLPDVDAQREFFQGIQLVNEQEGPAAAYLAWVGSIGVDCEPTYGPRSLRRANKDGGFVVRHHIMEMVEYMPDLAMMRDNGIPIVVAAGDGSLSGDYCYTRVARALAGTLGCPLVTFPGHHHSYEDRPDEFARSLAKTIHKFCPVGSSLRSRSQRVAASSAVRAEKTDGGVA
jgi:pimeloyl-ACP methyl ester carboxylesterase